MARTLTTFQSRTRAYRFSDSMCIVETRSMLSSFNPALGLIAFPTLSISGRGDDLLHFQSRTRAYRFSDEVKAVVERKNWVFQSRTRAYRFSDILLSNQRWR